MKLTARHCWIHGFTRTDLITVVGVSGLLLMPVLHSVGDARTGADLAGCMSNRQRLSAAWLMYAEENGGRLVPNHYGGSAGKHPSQPGWAGGWMDLGRTLPFNPDNVNARLLMEHNPAEGLYGGLLGAYLPTHRVFRCPADPVFVRSNNIMLPRVRSISMNGFAGDNARLPWSSQNFVAFRRLSDYAAMRPAQAWTLIDEREEGLEDPMFAIDMEKNVDSSGNFKSASATMVDYPAFYHSNGATLSFADGHSEYWHWRDPRTRPYLDRNQALTLNISMSGSPDLKRLSLATTVPVP